MRVRSVNMGRVWVCILSASEREESEDGEGRDVYTTLFQSDSVQ